MRTIGFWTCKKCCSKFEPSSGSRVCPECRPKGCAECGAILKDHRADKKVCDECKPKTALQRSRDWYCSNKQRKREYDEKRRLENPALYRAASKRHRIANPNVKNADTGARRKRFREATPKWANRFFIKEIYLLAIERSRATGFKWHVDHVIPLMSDLVCGLHVESNLQVIPAWQNLSKHNHYSLEHGGKK